MITMTVENEKAIRAVVRSAVQACTPQYLTMHDGETPFDCIRYCELGANRFVGQRYLSQTKEFLCLHQETIEDEIKDMLTFLESCKWVSITYSNGQTDKIPLSDFTRYNGLELEHNSQNIIINLAAQKCCSYTYTTDTRGEIVEKYPFDDIIIF